MKKILMSAAIILLFISYSAPERDPSVMNKAYSGDVSGEKSRDRNNQSPAADKKENTALVDVRVRVRTGKMTLVVGDIKAAEEALTAAINESSGYIAQSRIFASSGNLTLKIPEARFDSFIAKVETLGSLKSKEIATEDVTDKYFDLENRVKNKRIMLARYQDYLKNARSTQELLDLERAINDLTTEIESLEGSFRSLQNSVSYSTLTVNLELPAEMTRTIESPSLATGLRVTGEFFLAALYYLSVTVLFILAVAVPLGLFGGLIYFLGFGRLGLVVRFFRFLGPKKK
jgi:hypothetical protein